VSKQKSFRVVVNREDDAWLAEVDGLEGANTYARGLGGLEAYVREVIALAADLDPEEADEVDLMWSYRTGDFGLDAAMNAAAQSRARLLAVERATQDDLQFAVAVGRARGLSVRDIAAMTGVSHQRVAQVATRSEHDEIMSIRNDEVSVTAAPGSGATREQLQTMYNQMVADRRRAEEAEDAAAAEVRRVRQALIEHT